MAEKLVLAVDLGTSGPKVALVDCRGRVLDSDFEKTPVTLLPDGGAEQDPEGWWRAIVAAARRVLDRCSDSRPLVAAVSCTTQWSGTVAVDRSGTPLMNAVIWMDSRGRGHLEPVIGGRLTFQGYGLARAGKWLRLTGGLPGRSGKDPTAHILYIKHARPDVYERTHKFLEPKDYINFRLTGRFAAGPDSIALHWVTDNRDLSEVRYDDGLLRLCGIPRKKMPDLAPVASILGPLTPEAAGALGLPPEVAVCIGTPDVQGAALGSGGVRDNDAHLYIGTSSWLTCHVGYKKTDVLRNMASLPSAIPGRYFVANEQECAGACLNFLVDNLVFPDDLLRGTPPEGNPYELLMEAAANVPPGSDGLIFTPWLYGERTPVEDATVRGGFHNVTLETTRSHMVRSVLEGVAFNSRWLLEAVERFVKQPLPAVRMIGGGARSTLWCKIHADVFNRPILQVRDPIHAGVRGAAFLAAAALGKLRFEDIPDLVEVEHRHEPDPANRAMYDGLYAEFKTIYKKTRGIYARLNGGAAH
ncbi:MAG: xylulokinase [Desulfatibacillaceae bacterium]